MSQNVSDMMEKTISKIKEMVDVNTVIGSPVSAPDGITIYPVSKIVVGLGGGGSDYVSRHPNKAENPFGGGLGAGVTVTPLGFLVVKEGSVRMIPIGVPANATADRLVEQIPDTLEKIADFIDSRSKKDDEPKPEANA
ncbi:MAG: GerW family sporulation protein [Firmicutes bacterium]|nr:GerW family sporulation protein [Bacillota bacterium]